MLAKKRILRGQKYTGCILIDNTFFVYDGWNMIQERNNIVVREHVRGLDLSQSLQGAGGVGGLLAEDSSGVYYATFDANGNVSEYVKSSDSTVTAHYEYGPFGQTTSTGSSFPFRFSTKYLDVETGLYGYGFRYYDAELGRWRYPMEDKGALLAHIFLDVAAQNIAGFMP